LDADHAPAGLHGNSSQTLRLEQKHHFGIRIFAPLASLRHWPN
jgi:hypothetical protein